MTKTLFKKGLAVATALIMVLVGMASSLPNAFASPGHTLTINDPDEDSTRQYEVYQIFSGEITGTASNVKLTVSGWGDGVTDAGKTALGDAAAFADTLKDSKDANALAGRLVKNGYLQNAKTAVWDAATKTYKVENLDSGYYLVKEVDGSLAGKDKAYTAYIMDIVGNVTVDPKRSTPKFEKKVHDVNESEDIQADKIYWKDSADHHIGSKVEFSLKADIDMPAKEYERYSSYKVVMHDTLSKGLTPPTIDPKNFIFKINDTVMTPEQKEKFTITGAGQQIDISCEDIKAAPLNIKAGDKIYVIYEATLNENAVIGSKGNPNELYGEYSNNPNGEGTGTSPKDIVKVFTYQVTFNKVNKQGEALKGAEFKLEKKINGQYKDVSERLITTVTANTVKFEFRGLDDGIYKLTETKTPEGCKTMDPAEFRVVATHDTESDDPQLLTLEGEVMNPSMLFEGALKFKKDTGSAAAGIVTGDVTNLKKGELPRTGDVGTALIYALGVALLASGATLYTRRRKHSA